MPAATDTVLVTEQQLWTLVLAWTPITSVVLPGNRVRLDQLSIPWPEIKHGRLPADVPALMLEILNSRPDPKAPRTFCLQPDVNVVTFEWTVLGSDRTYNVLTQTLAELKACMKAAGTQLGIPATVARWESEWRAEVAPKAESGGVRRTRLRVQMHVVIKG